MCQNRPMRLGVSLPLAGLGLQAGIDIAVQASSWGYADAWTSESNRSDAFTPLVAVAAAAPTLRLGVGVVPAGSRPVALLAMTAATVDELTGGRLVLAIGASTDTVLKRWMGLQPAPPVIRLRETVQCLRSLFAGERVSFAGRAVRVDRFRLPRACAVPIYLGGHGEQTLHLAGAIADGVVLGNVPAAAVPRLLEDVISGRLAAGRDPDDLDVVCRVLVAVDEEPAGVYESVRRSVAGYASSAPYARFFSRIGYDPAMSRIGAAWAMGDSAAASRAVPAELAEGLCITGTAVDCARGLRAFLDNGVTTLVVVPVSAQRDPARRAASALHTLEAVAAQLLSSP